MGISESEIVELPTDRLARELGCRYDENEAANVLKYFARFLRHSKGKWAGQPFTPLEWQAKNVLAPLFGWKRADGTRRFRRGGIWVPKKNGKSTLAAAVAIYLLAGDNEPGAEVYAVASDRDQAGIVFGEAANMVQASPALSKRLKPLRSKNRIIREDTRSVLRALSSEDTSAEGLNIHGLIFDELHAQKSRRLWDAITYGGAARRQPVVLSISTAGWDRHSIGYEQYDYAKRILRGINQDWEFLPCVYEAEQDDDWTDPAVWRKANPSWGVTIDPKEFESSCREAQETPAKQNSFRRYRLNQWTEQEERYIDLDAWDRCVGSVDAALLRGQPCWCGLDLSSVRDLTSLELVFRMPDGTVVVESHFWAPGECAPQRERDDGVPYMQWQRDGFLNFCQGASINQGDIKRTLVLVSQVYDIRAVAVDPWNAAKLMDELSYEGLNVVKFPQTIQNFSPATKELDALVRDAKLRHGGHPVLRWNAANLTVRTDGPENVMPSKKLSTDRIDGIVALIMALAVSFNAETGGSVYDTEGAMEL